jgi:hypothetical protein
MAFVQLERINFTRKHYRLFPIRLAVALKEENLDKGTMKSRIFEIIGSLKGYPVSHLQILS